MIIISYILLPLKQLIRIKMAFFFTLLFPVILYLVTGQKDHPITLITFFNFAMQSAMLQTVGIFTSIHKRSAWGEYLSTLPISPFYPIMGVVIAMYIVGILGLGLISITDLYFYHTLTPDQMTLALISASLGAIPMGVLGYFIGSWADQTTSRNLLTLANLTFLFITLVPIEIQHMLALFSLPNTWLEFSQQLVLEKKFSTSSLLILIGYTLILLILVRHVSSPKKYYTDV